MATRRSTSTMIVRNVPHYTDIQSVEEWFSRQGEPIFTLYAGWQTGGSGESVILERQRDESVTMDQAWAIIQSALENTSGGDFTLHVATEANGKGNRCYIRMGEAISVGSRGASPSGFNDLLELHMSNYDLQRRVDDLQAGVIGKPTFMDKLGEKLGEIDLAQILGPLMQSIPVVLAQKAGGAASVQHQAVQDKPMQADQSVQGSSDHASNVVGVSPLGEKVLDVIGPIRGQFDSDEQFIAFIQMLTEQFSANPELYKSMLKNG